MAPFDSVSPMPDVSEHIEADPRLAIREGLLRVPRIGNVWAPAMCLLMLSFSSGCAALMAPVALVAKPVHYVKDQLAYNECVDEFARGWRNHHLAKHAWHAREAQFACHPHYEDIRRGFIDGYVEAANGGPGCLPITPPRRYWSWRYNSLHGQAQMNAWFEGFPYGVQAAEEDGVVFYGEIMVSDAITTQLEQHHPHAHFYNSPHWQAPGYQAEGYGVPAEAVPAGQPAVIEPIQIKGAAPPPPPAGVELPVPTIVDPVQYEKRVPPPQSEALQPPTIELQMPSIANEPMPVFPAFGPVDHCVPQEEHPQSPPAHTAPGIEPLQIIPVRLSVDHSPGNLPWTTSDLRLASWGVDEEYNH